MADIFNDIELVDRTIQIIHPKTGDEVGIEVDIMSMDDERMKKIKRSILDRRLKLDQRGKNFNADDIEENTNTLIFSAMTGWRWLKDANGEQNTYKGEIPAFHRRTVFMIFQERQWFRDQIDEAIAEDKAFFGNSKSI